MIQNGLKIFTLCILAFVECTWLSETSHPTTSIAKCKTELRTDLVGLRLAMSKIRFFEFEVDVKALLFNNPYIEFDSYAHDVE